MRAMKHQSSVAPAPSNPWRRVTSKSFSGRMAIGALLLCGVLARGQAKSGDTIGVIDFFGYQGLDVAKVRAALPVHEGDQLDKQTKRLIEDAVERAVGKKPTQVHAVCCDRNGRSLIYIGLAVVIIYSLLTRFEEQAATH